jgi:hypothetical protein
LILLGVDPLTNSRRLEMVFFRDQTFGRAGLNARLRTGAAAAAVAAPR